MDGLRIVQPLFQAEGGGSIPTSALQLHLHRIDFEKAKELNRRWHSRLPRFGTGCVKRMPFLCYGASFEDVLYAVAIWSNPAARLLPQKTWLELRRLAIAPDSPKNTGSRMLRIMAMLVRSERPELERLISYQDTEAHTGCIYRAAGWVMVDTTASCTDWNMPGRPRPESQSKSPKVRWEKVLTTQ
jgi:hypothetical protein